MRQLRWVVLVVLLCASLSSAWGQGGAKWVYVSGTDGSILRVTSSGAITTLVAASSAAAYEGLVVGPDNGPSINGYANHGFLLYACDPTHNTIIRFDPENTASGTETVYQGTAASPLQQPQCGRFTNAGDLIVTSKAAGSGAWDFAGVANIALKKGGFPTPVQKPAMVASSLTQVSQGVAQKNIGDLLVVDAANKEVIRSQYGTIPPFRGSSAVFIFPSSSLLPGPFGIARRSAGDVFVSNQSKKNQIVHYTADGKTGATCVNSLGSNIAPAFMQMSADDTLYVAAATSSKGFVYSVNAGTCASTQIATSRSLPPLVGIALPPTSVSQTQAFSGTTTFNFGFTAYQFTSPSCTLTVTATPTNLAVINSSISDAALNDATHLPFGGTPAVNLGWDGFEFMVNVINRDASGNFVACAPQFVDTGSFTQLLGAQVDNLLVGNPRMVRCPVDVGDPDEGSSCALLQPLGDYPLGGLLPSDGTLSGTGKKCNIFLINANLSTVPAEAGKFCGFQSPLSNVAPPGIAGTFSSGQNLALKFKLAEASGDCQNGPFITDAVALLSVAQLFDRKGTAVFNPVSIGSSGSSTPAPPTFKVDSNKQYQLSLSLHGYAPGTYSITVTFLTSNASSQTVFIKVL